MLVENIKSLFDRIFRIKPLRNKGNFATNLIKYFIYVICFAFSVLLLSFVHSAIYSYFDNSGKISLKFLRNFIFSVFLIFMIFI